MEDVKEQPHIDTHELQQSNNDNAPNGDVGLGWQDGHDTGRNGNNYDDSAAEPDSHGTGIKEDG